MALALMEDATGESDLQNTNIFSDGINIHQFKKVLLKHKGILDNLEISLFLPKMKKRAKLSENLVKPRHSEGKKVLTW